MFVVVTVCKIWVVTFLFFFFFFLNGCAKQVGSCLNPLATVSTPPVHHQLPSEFSVDVNHLTQLLSTDLFLIPLSSHTGSSASLGV